jgi:BolA protein
MTLGPVGQQITAKLREAFAPAVLEVVDESHKHKGHAGAREGGESHFRVRIVSAAFAGLSRIERHRRVNRVLAAELEGPVHALAIAAEPPSE